MRWDALFADLQAQWEAEQRSADDEEIRELAEAEAAATRLGDRVRARRGHPLTVRLVDGSDRSGVVVDVAQEWVLLAEGERRHLVPMSAVALVWPLAGAAPPPAAVDRGLGLGHVLRALAAEGQQVLVRTLGGDQVGLVVRVGADHLDLATQGGVLGVPWAALTGISST